MKKVFLYISFIIPLFSLLLVSCSDDPMDKEDTGSPALSRRSYTDEQLKIQRLGFAYNAAGNVMDDGSFSTKAVVNMNRLEAAQQNYGLIINSERRHYTSMDIFSGNTLQELGHQETKYTIDESDTSSTTFRNWSRTERQASPKPMLHNSLRPTAHTSSYRRIWEE